MSSAEITAIAFVAVVFCIGLNFGCWIAERFNRRLRTAHAELGEEFAEMLKEHRKTTACVGSDVEIQTIRKFTSSGYRYTMVLAAHKIEEAGNA